MGPIELLGRVDEQGRLLVELPNAFRPGPVKVTVQPVLQQSEEEDWRAILNQTWAADWSDPREDIYTLEDGEPEHGTR